jgi:AcrR family transcriptional regulator
MYIHIYIMSRLFVKSPGMPKTVLPTHQTRSRESLVRLLKAAAEVLDKDGLDGATIPRIAARAGLTPGALYRRFPDKDALLREVCLRLLQENYTQSQELLKPERWKGMSLEEISRFVIGATLKGHRLHRGLLRALLFFTRQHPDAAFVRKTEELEWKVFRDVADLLLTRRDEIRHPDPESAVRFAMLMVGISAQGVLVLPPEPKDLCRLLPHVETQLERELPRMFLRYLGVEERKAEAVT